MASLNVYDAKTNLSKLLERAVAGEEIIIAKAGKPMVRLVPVMEKRGKPVWGLSRGQASPADAFDAPTSEDELALWHDVSKLAIDGTEPEPRPRAVRTRVARPKTTRR